jgi:hypothetical protein
MKRWPILTASVAGVIVGLLCFVFAFVDEPPSIAQGGRGVVVPGCPTCEKDLYGYPTL